jgi:CBS domain-containing protein
MDDPTMRIVETLLSGPPATIDRDASADEARRRLYADGVHGLAVVDDRSHLVGIITATDLLALDDLTADLSSSMTTDVLTVSRHTSIADAARTMRANRIHHLVVTEPSGTVVGVISSYDLLDVIAPGDESPEPEPVGRRARVGDVIVVRGKAIDRRVRRGRITEVRGPDGHPPFMVQWLDDPHAEPHDVLYFPGSDADIEPPTAG